MQDKNEAFQSGYSAANFQKCDYENELSSLKSALSEALAYRQKCLSLQKEISQLREEISVSTIHILISVKAASYQVSKVTECGLPAQNAREKIGNMERHVVAKPSHNCDGCHNEFHLHLQSITPPLTSSFRASLICNIVNIPYLGSVSVRAG